MDCEKGPPTVIEMLMGFDTRPLQRPTQKRQRVLSENYVRKSASLHFSQKRVSGRSCSPRIQVAVDSDMMDTTEAPTASYMEQRPYTDCCISTDFMSPQSCPDYPVICKPSHNKEVFSKYGQWSDCMRSNNFKGSKGNSAKPCHINEMKLPSPFKFGIKKKAMNFQEIKMQRNALKLQQNREYIPDELSKQRFGVDFSKQLVKHEGEGKKEVSLSLPGIAHTEQNSVKDPIHSTDFSPYNRKHEDLCSPKGSQMKMHISSIQPQDCQGADRYLAATETVKSSKVKSMLQDSEVSLSEQPPALHNSSGDGIHMEPSHRLNPFISAMDSDICVSADTFMEASDSYSETSSVSCQTPEPLSPTSSEGISHPSPISVLDSPSKERVSSNMDCFMNASSSHDRTEYVEAYSEGHAMTVSSDDENGEESTGFIQENVELPDFSYLISVINEACVQDDMSHGMWHSSEHPIDPRVFDMLEKTLYGKHVSRPRSERRLLFDRIILGLKDIIKLCISMHQISVPVGKRLGSRWTRQGIEEELRLLLISQDKEATKAKILNPSKRKAKKSKHSDAMKDRLLPSADDLKYSEVEDYMDEIVIEVEKYIMDELIDEFVYAENF